MLGDYFYNQRIRKAVAVFGALFNDINVVRANSSGNVISQQKVPLSYAPKRDFLARLDQMEKGELAERQVAVKLPRMSFEIVGMNYDAARQIPKMNQCKTFPTEYNGVAQKLYSPVPYSVQFQLSIYAKSQDDALQIVEQILPFFTPNYTLKIKPIDGLDIEEDAPITLTGVSFSDDYEAALESRRTIIYTLDFEMKITLYKGVQNNVKIIEKACVDFLSLDGSELYSQVCTDSAYGVNPVMLTGSTLEDQTYSRTITITNIPENVTALSVSAPDKGTASASLTKLTTNSQGIVTAQGTWTYNPQADYFGVDSFNVILQAEGGNKSFPVSMEILPVTDTVTDFVTMFSNDSATFSVSANDTFASQNVTHVIAAGGQPDHGIIEILDAATGQFKYTPDTDFAGQDTVIYRVIPTDFPQGSEAGTINITVDFEEPVMGAQVAPGQDPQPITDEQGNVLEFDQNP